MSPLWISVKTSLAATALTFVLGLAAARALSTYRGRGRGLIDGILTLPLVLPPTVVGFFLLLIFGRRSAIGQALEHIGITIAFSWPATVVAATVVAFPLMYRTALGAFEQVSPNLLDAARTLGAGEWRVFRHVWLPLAWPGVLAGTVLAFARALGEFGATLMLAGNIPGRTQTMPIAIFFAAEGGDLNRALLWVGLTVAMSLAAIAALNTWARPRPVRIADAAEPPDAVGPAPLPEVFALAGAGGSLEVNARKRYPTFEWNTTFTTRGGALGLLGASGSGKSMTLRAIAGLVTPDEGRIVLNGRVLFDSAAGIRVPPAARRVGIVFQDYALFPHLNVRQNIAFGMRDPAGAAEWAKLAHVDDLLERYPGQISGGQRQRVAIARALAMKPEALLLDEPFSALDPHLRRQMEEQLRELLAAYRGATIFVTHDRNEAYRIADEIVLLSRGRVAAAGPKHDLFQRPETLEAARVTGCKNFAPLKTTGPRQARIEAWECDLRTAIAIPTRARFLGIRAHHLEFVDTPGENTFPCWLAGSVESPFEITLYLRLHAPGPRPHLEAEISLDRWAGLSAVPQPWLVRLDPARLLLLRE
jgi:molybdate transport system ATP-binding protein/molybdate transport system permease protein